MWFSLKASHPFSKAQASIIGPHPNFGPIIARSIALLNDMDKNAQKQS
jgi:hypothetical protein